ncbi:Argonaute complex, subunit Arb1 [Hypoxylon sp. NC1633]|nr:Argonaute complex, subunit Arb1 [Hypoxylon sp. NC1633]
MATDLGKSTSGEFGEHHEPDGSGNATSNGVPASEDAKPTNVDMASDDIERGSQPGTESDPKKKKKNKPKKTVRKNITGFEEFFADAPMTPAEAANEKKEVYPASRGFPDRIEECIQRYRASRRMDNERTKIFNKYLGLGGIDTSPRQFTGFAEDRDALADADAEQIRRLTATDFIGGSGSRYYDPAKPDHWFVDFEGIVKGFLSRTIPDIYMYDEQINEKAATTVKNFLNYVLMHDVCLEYTDNIKAAKSICDLAPIELRMVHELFHGLPGVFNAAASSLFCDRLVDLLDEADNFEKLVVFRLAILTSPMVDEKIKASLMSSEDPGTIHIVNTKEESYQVVDLIKPRRRDIALIQEKLEEAAQSGKVKPVGLIKLKPSIIELGFDNQPRADEIDLSGAELEEYILEDDLLAKFEKGMKIRADVCELNIGVRFIKKVNDIRVSFDQFLPQMLMENWRDPVPNDRPPPSASDPDADEKALKNDEL